MSTDALTNEVVSVGEGFAFFRWHCINWSFTSCRGFNDPRSACDTLWMALAYKPKLQQDCIRCDGSGLSTPGTGYDSVCDDCGGQSNLPADALLSALDQLKENAGGR
jgi:hypothetical protein